MKNIDELKDIIKVQGIYAKGFGSISKIVMQDQRLTIDAKAIYAYFCSFACAGNTVFPSVNKICHDLKIKKFETFKKHRGLLELCGYIKVEQSSQADGKFGRNIYMLIMNPVEIDNGQFSPIPEKGVSEPISKKRESKKSEQLKWRIQKIGNLK